MYIMQCIKVISLNAELIGKIVDPCTALLCFEVSSDRITNLLVLLYAQKGVAYGKANGFQIHPALENGREWYPDAIANGLRKPPFFRYQVKHTIYAVVLRQFAPRHLLNYLVRKLFS